MTTETGEEAWEAFQDMRQRTKDAGEQLHNALTELDAELDIYYTTWSHPRTQWHHVEALQQVHQALNAIVDIFLTAKEQA